MLRRATIPTALACAAFLLAGTAHAAPFQASAGQLALQVGGLPTLAIQTANAGTVTDLGGPIQEQTLAFGTQTFDLSDTLFTGVPSIADLRIGVGDTGHNEAVDLTDPDGLGKPAATATFSTGFATTANAVGADFAGAFGGTAPLVGTATICLGGCDDIALQVPLGYGGVGGTVSGTALGLDVFARGGGAWTAGPAQITFPSTTPDGRMAPGVTLSHDAASSTAAATTAAIELGPTFLATATPVTQMEFALGTTFTMTSTTRAITLTGGDARGPAGAGSVTLVTPIRADTGSGLADSLGLFAIQTLSFVPEPGTLLLLGSGVLGLGALGRRRMRR